MKEFLFKTLLIFFSLSFISFTALAYAPKLQSADFDIHKITQTKPETEANSSQVEKPQVPENALRVPILMYHHVGYAPSGSDGPRYSLTLSPELFKEQLAWFKQEEYQSVSLEQVYQASQNQFTLPAKPIVFTFDDGYDDVFIYAVPLLVQYGFIGSFGVVTHFTATHDGTNTYATWEQIKEAQVQGMEIVSHTQTHFDATRAKYNREFKIAELVGSKKDLAEHGIQTNVFIYPYGHYNSEYQGLVAEAGYKLALTTAYGKHVDPNNLLTVPRIRVHGNQNFEKLKELILY